MSEHVGSERVQQSHRAHDLCVHLDYTLTLMLIIYLDQCTVKQRLCLSCFI